MANCVLTNTEEFKSLYKDVYGDIEFKNPEIIMLSAKVGVWQDKNGLDKYPTSSEITTQNVVDYHLKSIPILQSNKAKQIFEKGKKNSWSLDKILSELQIPKEQKQLILNLGITNREQLALELASNYSFAVEVDVAKGLGDTFSLNNKYYLVSFEDEISYYADIEGNELITENVLKYRILNPNGAEAFEFENKIDAEKKLEELNSNLPNSNIYVNLTVPGGTNYTENEISTPLITPSIKGHAQFATEKGIGWFRSDEKGNEDTKVKKEDIQKWVLIDEDGDRASDEFDSKEAASLYKKSINSNLEIVETYYPADLKYRDSTKTRRILEVQSDLFQNWRNNFEFEGSKYTAKKDDKNVWHYYKNGNKINANEYTKTWKTFLDTYLDNADAFTKLLQKDNNWVTFFIKSIIQDSAKKGYEKVLFPTGNTASKIEGHTTLEEFKKQKEDKIKELENYKLLDGENFAKAYFNINMYNSKTKQEQKELIQKEKNNINNEINQLKQELERVETEGFGALKPIYNFYENTVTNILNKTYGEENVKLIIDEYGNTWNEVTLNLERDLAIIQKSKQLPEERFKEILNYHKLKSRQVKFDPNTLKSLKELVNKANEDFGGTYFYVSTVYEKNVPKIRLGFTPVSKEVTESIAKSNAYSRWFNSLTKQQKISENALRIQEGSQPIPLTSNGDSVLQKNSPLSSESMDTATQKINVLSRIFDVEVIVDESIEDAGQVIPGKNGLKPTLVINPSKLKSDTVIHEYAHIFIDALGGLKNARIAAAVKQLYDTELWREVAEMYPELNGDNLAKEVLATAMGREGSQLFADNEYKRNWWTRFMDWVNERIANLLGQDVNYVKSLSKDLFNEENSLLQLASSDIVQKSKYKEALQFQKERQLEKLSVEKLNDKALARIETRQKILRNAGYDEYANKLVELKNDIKTVVVTKPILGIYKFVEFANRELNAQDYLIGNQLADNNITEFTVNMSEKFAAIFEDIQMFIDILNENKHQIAEEGVDTTQLMFTLQQLAANKTNYEAKQRIATKRAAVNILSQRSNYSQGIARIEYEREANAAGLKDEAKQNYIEEKLRENAETFFQKNVEFYSDLMDTTLSDIDWVESWLFDANNISSHTIQILHALINGASTLTRQQTREDEIAIFAAFEEFTKTKSGSLKEMYKNIYTEGSDGQLYLVSAYSPEFGITLNKLEREYQEIALEKGENSEEAIAKQKENSKWFLANTTTGKNADNMPIFVPVKKWKDGRFEKLTADEKKFLGFAKSSLNVKDTFVPSSARLSKSPSFTSRFLKVIEKKLSVTETVNDEVTLIVHGGRLQRLPAITARDMELLYEKGPFEMIKKKISKAFTIQGDETDMGDISNRSKEDVEKGIRRVFATESNEERKEIPVFFRNKVKTPSYDIPSLLLLNSYAVNNYKNKRAILPKIEVLQRATAEKDITKTLGFGQKFRLYATGEATDPITKKGIESREYQTLLSIVEDNIFGVSTIDLHTTFLGADMNKVFQSLAGWTSDSMLMLNYLSAGANVLQGKTMNLIEQLSKGAIGKNALVRGEKRFWNDISDIMKDLGATHQNSKTNLLLELFNIKGDYSALSTFFFQNTKVKGLMTTDSLHGGNNLGEYYTASTLMYSLLDEIKVMNKDKKYIDKDGNVVDSKDKAMSLADAYEVKDGKLQFKHTQVGSKKIEYTSRDFEKPYDPADIANYMGKVYSDLHGQYNKELQSMAQRTAVGKLVFMLRKWMVQGFLRRYRGIGGVSKREVTAQDKFYSQALMSEQEGTYTSAIRFVLNIKRNLKELGFLVAHQNTWNELTDVEKANVKKAITELAVIALTFSASTILYALAKGTDDEDEKKALFLTTFYTRRLYSELAFFIYPGEQIRMLRSPAASVSMIEATTRLFNQATSDMWGLAIGEGVEVYVRGPRKGQPKIIKKTEQVLPIMKNLSRDIEASTDFLWNSF